MRSKFYLFILSFFVCLHHNSQSQIIKGKVVDSRTKLGIPFANVYHPKLYVGVHTSEEGDFLWDIKKKNDTIIISNIGYKTVKVPVGKFQEDITNIISLEEVATELMEVTINATKLKNYNKSEDIEIGYYDFNNYGKTKWRPGGITELEIFATFLPNPSKITGIIKSVKYDVDGFRNLINRPKARIRVMAVDSVTNLPSYDLLQENIILSLNRLSNNLTVDLSKYNIPFPEKGLFVGIEFFCLSTWTIDKNNISQEKSSCPYVPITKLVDKSDNAKSYYWTFNNGKWKWVCITDGSVYAKGLMYKFGATISTRP